MKKLLLTSLAFICALFSFGQTASNFNCNDCSAVNHDLFTELNSGKVIVIAWVMPCGACIGGGLAGYTTVQNYSVTNPGQVKFYLADDVANTTCASLTTWGNTNGMTNPDARFSDALVNMAGYGAAGMPKVIVVGGTSHTVYYNQNGASVTASGIQTAINNALAAIAAGVKENTNNTFASANVYPNPSNSSSSISLNLQRESKIKIEVQNLLGQKVSEVFNGTLPQGENTLKINTSELSNGNYFVSFSDGNSSNQIKLIVSH